MKMDSPKDLQAIFDNMSIGIAYMDRNLRVIKINKFLERLFGIRKEDVVGKYCYEIAIGLNDSGGSGIGSEADNGNSICSFCKKDECFTSRQPITYERPMGGSVLRLTAIPEIGQDGSVERFLELIEDVTVEKYVEEKMVLNYQIQKVMASILQISLEPITLQDQLDRIIDQIFSIQSLTLQNKGSIFLVDDGSSSLILKAHRGFDEQLLAMCSNVPFGYCLCGKAAASGKIVFADHVDYRHNIKLENSQPHGHYCVPIISGGNVLGVINLYVPGGHKRDLVEENFLLNVANTLAGVIERKRAEDTLRARQELLRSIVQSTQDAIITIDNTGRVIFWNKGAEAIFGFTSAEMTNRSATSIIPERYHMAHNDGLARILKNGMSVLPGQTYELVGLRKDGQEFPLELSVADWKAEERVFFTAVIRNITKRKQTELELQDNITKLRKAVGGFIQTIAMTVEVRDPYTAGHQKRVANLARAIADEMGLSHEMVDGIRMSGVIHDIGKIYVPAEILSKPGKLNSIEFSLIKLHSQVGYDILKNVEFPWPVADIILQHHEKLDGSGYPGGLKGDEILIEARIICVADVVEAISWHRPYRPALGVGTAMAEITQNRGILYDCDAVDACLRLFNEKDYKLE